MRTLLLALAGIFTISAHAEFDYRAEFFQMQPLGGPYEYEVDARVYKTPTRQVKEAEYPVFADDYDLRGMQLAILRQLKRFNSKSLVGHIEMGGKSYPLVKVQDSLKVFNGLIEEFNRCVGNNLKERCYQDLNDAIKKQFNVFVPNLVKKDPRFGKENFALFTGYNTYHVEGKLKPEGEFKHAIYSNPHNPKLNKSRVQIDYQNALAGRGLEQAYVKSLFDIYMMHVQGSGKITVNADDGSAKDYYLHWDGTNRQRWEFISLYMARKGYLVNGSIPSQRKFMRENEDKQREIFGQCPSYIYLKRANDVPKGSDATPVTDGRTLAQDNATYPFKGLIAYVQSQRPAETGSYNLEEEKKSNVPFIPFSRFFLDQDTGGAINGKARADIYFGSDEYAMFAAMYQAEVGKVHFLLLK